MINKISNSAQNNVAFGSLRIRLQTGNRWNVATEEIEKQALAELIRKLENSEFKKGKKGMHFESGKDERITLLSPGTGKRSFSISKKGEEGESRFKCYDKITPPSVKTLYMQFFNLLKKLK